MRTGDLIWLAGLAAVVGLLVVPDTQRVFVQATATHPYLVGFAKFFVLATMGELLALRIVTGVWTRPRGLLARAIVWGLLGVAIVLVFEIFASGVASAIAKGLLPGSGSRLAFAVLVSATMNVTFAPTMMLVHRMTDTWIDLRCDRKGDRKGGWVGVSEIVDRIEWKGFVDFVLLKTIPIFRIPAHTVTFLLPPEYRVFAAAMLSIALGAILAFAKKRSRPVRA